MPRYEGKLELTWTNKDQRLLAHGDGSYEWLPASDYRIAEVRLLNDVETVGAVGKKRCADIEQNDPGAPERRRVGRTIRCHFCKRISCWVHAGTGRQVCSGCKVLIAEANWDELARKSLKWYPDEWVSDVSAFLQMTFEGASFPESVVPLVVCEGCDGSLCGRAHAHRRVLPAATVVARNPKDAEG